MNFRTSKILVVGILALSGASKALACGAENLRWASSSNTVYVTGQVTCTLTDLSAFVKTESLELIDTVKKIWLLKSNLRLQEGAKLILHGSAIEGDVNELRLLSGNDPITIIRINARWGAIDIENAKVTSFDPNTGGPDFDTSNGRSYIHVQSFLDTGDIARESRMDIKNSEISYLGYYAAESYGLVWKVIGNQQGLYDKVDVLGDVIGNYIHDNYMGMYTYGTFGMQITDNEIAYNESYGIDPHDDSDQLVISNNVSHDNGNHGIICSRRCDHLTISDNIVYNNAHGIMLHRDTNYSLVENNDSYDNRDTGIVLFESHHNIIRNNRVMNNRHGIRLSLGSHDNHIENNEVEGSEIYGLYLFKGSDIPETTDGRSRNNLFMNNVLRDNGTSLKLSDADHNTFEANEFVGSNEIKLYDGQGNRLVSNISVEMLTIRTTGSEGLPGSSIVQTDKDTVIVLNEFSSTVLKNPDGMILDPEEKDGETNVTAEGSSITLTPQVIGAMSLVTARKFWVIVSKGSVTIKDIGWSAINRSWISQAGFGGISASYRIGDLIPNGQYDVYRNDELLQSITADADGVISFTDTADSTEEVLYSVSSQS